MIFKDLHPRFHDMLIEHGTELQLGEYVIINRLLREANVFNAPIIISKFIDDNELSSNDGESLFYQIRDTLGRDSFWWIDEFKAPIYL